MAAVLILCYCLQSAENCSKLTNSFQLVNLICAYSDVFFGLTGMLMSKNINNDVSKDLPIALTNVNILYWW